MPGADIHHPWPRVPSAEVLAAMQTLLERKDLLIATMETNMEADKDKLTRYKRLLSCIPLCVGVREIRR